MSPEERERHEARLMTTSEIVALRRSFKEAQVYIAELQDTLRLRDSQLAAAGVPLAVSDEPTARHRRVA